MTHAVVGSRGLGILVLACGALWLAGFAALGTSLPHLAVGAGYTLLAAAVLSHPGRLGRALLGLYLSAVVLVWAAIVLPSTRDLTIADWFAWDHALVLGVSLLWGGFVWAGLLAFPFLIATLLPRRSPSGVGSTPQTLWTAGNGPRPPVSVEHVDPPRQLPGRG
ncbi:hypothetical protein J4N02_01045 [Propioniciclava sp. MC1595]|uniref:hypothetical protein n=1 Tax=unclassified Propioniciclava TaxID=2642922 RepID=UPI0016048CF0|nr:MULTISPECIES: hypothetical protein [unclassified Propioniciclava]MBB1495043.1 hypothetical protein [Propioniciclava sp. MC1595]MBB1502317.1 hypothetical protein [Propioniciclava sp. MC1683]NLE18232.1 hypothetical protein [Propioniciclava sp.]QTE26256.1 hypothetical protein J4N02_01045 [Propioniciclava sp. MC1595]